MVKEKKLTRLEMLKKELENKKNAIKTEERRIKAEADRERKNRLIKHGGNLEAIFGEADSDTMMILIFEMLKTLKDKGEYGYTKNDFARKVGMFGELRKEHQKQLSALMDLNDKVVRGDVETKFITYQNEEESFNRRKLIIINSPKAEEEEVNGQNQNRSNEEELREDLQRSEQPTEQ